MPDRSCSTTETPFTPDGRNTAVSPDLPAAPLPPSVEGKVSTPVGPVPRIGTSLTRGDRLGMWKVRWGFGRMHYAVRPGLYAVGDPDPQSEVLVTANYRLTFDLLRRAVEGLDVWILVLDTNGINVWCASGKGTFCTEELVGRIGSVGLGAVVEHRRLILPQLGAVGIAAHQVRDRSGFRVLYGPVEMTDIKAYLAAGRKADAAMREKKFPLAERVVLTPMELVPAAKWVVIFTALLAAVGGLAGPGAFTGDALQNGAEALVLLSLAVICGALVVPILLPWLPGQAFSAKGTVTGAAGALAIPFLFTMPATRVAGWAFIVITFSSFLAMNFTGSSTYTSLSGVRREMRLAVPLQAAGGVVGMLLWFISLFINGGGA